jgi:hypothetical protein
MQQQQHQITGSFESKHHLTEDDIKVLFFRKHTVGFKPPQMLQREADVLHKAILNFFDYRGYTVVKTSIIPDSFSNVEYSFPATSQVSLLNACVMFTESVHSAMIHQQRNHLYNLKVSCYINPNGATVQEKVRYKVEIKM